LVFSYASGQYRNVIDISVIHHGFEGLFGIARLKFVFDMALPEIREALAPVRSSLKAQTTREMLEAPQIGDLGSNRIEMETSGPGEAVVLAWVITDRNSGVGGEGSTDGVLSLWRAILVLARDMKQQRAVQVRSFGERLFDADSVIANSRVRP